MTQLKGFCCLLVMTILYPLTAGVNQDLGRFFNKLGGASNVTRAGAYKDQAAGFYTGGNLFARNQVHHSQLMHMQLPDFRAGCGGIDMFMGAFSHISSERMIEALKTIGSNMASYAMLLAIETMSPQVKNILTELNDMAQKLNQANINSCEIAATTLGSVWPKSDASKRHLCKMIGTDKRYGSFSDYAAARQGCGAGGKRDQTIEAAQSDPRFKAMLGTEFNLAWMAIQENAFLREDRQLAEFFMSVSGTIISRKEGDAYTLVTRIPLADKGDLLSALLYGGEVRLYRCANLEDNKCLATREHTLFITPENALVQKVKNLLVSIQNKVYHDQPLSKAEIDFLNATRLPFYKIINVSTAYRRGTSPVDIIDYAELGAVDILFQYLSEILDVIHESVHHMRLNQVDDTQINRFQNALLESRRRIKERRMGSFKQMEQIMGIVRKTELLERSLMNKAVALSTEGL